MILFTKVNCSVCPDYLHLLLLLFLRSLLTLPGSSDFLHLLGYSHKDRPQLEFPNF